MMELALKSGTRTTGRKLRPRKQKKRQGNRPVQEPATKLESLPLPEAIPRGGVACPFPWRLHEMLDHVDEMGLKHIVFWNDDGKSFTVSDSGAFVKRVMPHFFSQTKFASFLRQLNLYNFSRCQDQPRERHAVSYRHEMFVRGQKELVRLMVRSKIKGTGPPRSKAKIRKQEDIILPPKKTTSSRRISLVDCLPGVCTQNFGMDYQESNKPPDDAAPVSPSSKAEVPTVGADEHLEDGDLVFFEGSPFHFLDPKTLEGFSSEIKSELHLPTGITPGLRPTLAPRPSLFSESRPLQHPKLHLPRFIFPDIDQS